MQLNKWMILDTNTEDPNVDQFGRTKYIIVGEYWTKEEADAALEKSLTPGKKNWKVVSVTYDAHRTPGWPFMIVENDYKGAPSQHSLDIKGYVYDLCNHFPHNDDFILRSISSQLVHASELVPRTGLSLQLHQLGHIFGDLGAEKVGQLLYHSAAKDEVDILMNAVYKTATSICLCLSNNDSKAAFDRGYKISEEDSMLVMGDEPQNSPHNLHLLAWRVMPYPSLKDPKEQFIDPVSGEEVQYIKAIGMSQTSGAPVLLESLAYTDSLCHSRCPKLFVTPDQTMDAATQEFFNNACPSSWPLSKSDREELNKQWAKLIKGPVFKSYELTPILEPSNGTPEQTQS